MGGGCNGFLCTSGEAIFTHHASVTPRFSTMDTKYGFWGHCFFIAHHRSPCYLQWTYWIATMYENRSHLTGDKKWKFFRVMTQGWVEGWIGEKLRLPEKNDHVFDLCRLCSHLLAVLRQSSPSWTGLDSVFTGIQHWWVLCLFSILIFCFLHILIQD